MMSLIEHLVVGVTGVLILLVGLAFLRALTAKLCTGKWPHEDAQAKSIYDNLP